MPIFTPRLTRNTFTGTRKTSRTSGTINIATISPHRVISFTKCILRRPRRDSEKKTQKNTRVALHSVRRVRMPRMSVRLRGGRTDGHRRIKGPRPVQCRGPDRSTRQRDPRGAAPRRAANVCSIPRSLEWRKGERTRTAPAHPVPFSGTQHVSQMFKTRYACPREA